MKKLIDKLNTLILFAALVSSLFFMGYIAITMK